MRRAYCVIILSFNAWTVKSQGSLALPQPGEILGPGGGYHQYACEQGPLRNNVAFNCIKILDELHRTPPDPVSFGHRYWEDKIYGCHVTAEVNRGSERPNILIRDLPADLIFLIYRCFVLSRQQPARSASINVGTNGAYRIRIYPPRGGPVLDGISTLPSSPETTFAADPAIAPNPSTTLANSKSSLKLPPIYCSRQPPYSETQFTECLPVLMQIVNDPGSTVRRTWLGEDSKEWHAPFCRMSIGPRHPGKMGGDMFSEGSLIDDALWIMGKCFAGPEAARKVNSGWKPVGPLENWKIALTVGLNLVDGIGGS